jgi:predicted DNA-binding transcriptional regulator AlpA
MARPTFTETQLAQRAGVSVRVLWREVRRGRCPMPVDFRRMARWDVALVEPWIELQRERAITPQP